MSAAASLLGLAADAEYYDALVLNVSASFQAAFWNGSAYPTQCAAGFALSLNITPTPVVAAAQDYILKDVRAQGNVTTSGEIGNRYALLALAAIASDAGNDAIWASLLRTNAPGYGWMLTMGETALAETWFDEPGDSHIHAMYGQIDEWLYRYVAGIQQTQSGWASVLIAPALLPGLSWVNATFDSPHGLIQSAYYRDIHGGTIQCTVAVPPGVTAEIVLPLSRSRVKLIPGVRHVIYDEVTLV
jgi:alpha-L-rhamnosidase